MPDGIFTTASLENTLMDWVAEREVNFSHYIIEKSTDGKEFRNLTMIFSSESGSTPHYSYSESLEKTVQGSL